MLMVVTALTILSLILVEFSTSSVTHVHSGTNISDDIRATVVGDTALVMTRACLDPKAWGPLSLMQEKMDLQRLCDLMLGIFVRGRVDLPLGGLSVEMEGIKGLGMEKGDVEEVTLTPEESYIGLAGLYCENRAELSCGNRVTTIRKLRSLLCDPSIASNFEKEQPDGHRYTREEVIGNLIDWIDADDNRINIDPATWLMAEGAGEGEDAYLKDSSQRYRSKDAPFDSIEELRMVRGISDELYDFLKDKVSVHAAGEINVNSASVDVIASILMAHSPGFQKVEVSACGEDSTNPDITRDLFRNYARIIVDARQAKQMLPQFLLSKPFKDGNAFIAVAKDPLSSLEALMGQFTGGMGNPLQDRNMVLMSRYQMTLPAYTALMTDIQWNDMKASVGTENNLFRVRAKTRVGNITRSLFAILKRDGQTVRTLYYRED